MGASWTESTVIFAVLWSELNAVVPPLVDVSTLVPAVPAVELPVIDRWSQARKVNDPPDPKKSALGRKRSLSATSKRRDCDADTLPTGLKSVPLIENSRVPLDTDVPVMAMASTGVSSSSSPGFTASFASVMELAGMRAAMVVPVLEARD